MGKADPILWSAALLGAKTVRSRVMESRLAVKPWAEPTRPARPERPAATRVVEMLAGMVRTLSMIWMTPPVKFVS